MAKTPRTISANPQQPTMPQSDRKSYANPFPNAKVKSVAVPSGSPLSFEQDEEALFRFLGLKNIKSAIEAKTGKPSEDAFYLIFSDGRKVRSVSQTYKLEFGPDGKKIEWHVGIWYYIHCEDMVPTKLNAMFDYNIYELGKDGDKIPTAHKGISPTGEITLSDDACAEANYTRLNYPAPGTKRPD